MTHGPPPLRPTGRRRITEAQLSATAGLTGRFDPVSPGRVLSALKRAAPALGLPRRLVDLMDHLMGYTREIDWQGNWAPIVWPSNATLQDVLGVGPTRVKELIREALDAGLMTARDHGTGKRFGIRGEGGRIVRACGFDLSPLAERMAEFERVAAEHEARRAEAKQLRAEISRTRYAILTLTDMGTTHAVQGTEWTALADRAKELARPVRASWEPRELVPVLARLRALHAQTDAAIRVAFPVKSDPQGPEYRPHNTTTNQLPIVNTIANAGDSPAVNKSSGGNQPLPLPTNRPATMPERPSALRGFPATPELVLQIAPPFRLRVSTSKPHWPEIIEAAWHVRSELDISQHAWGQACIVLGRLEAATALAAIAAKHEAGLVRSPGGLLRHMVAAHQEGTLRLDRTLFGLVDRAKGSAGRARRDGLMRPPAQGSFRPRRL